MGALKARVGSIQYCSSPQSMSYQKARREGLSVRHIYIALLCGAVCFSTWALLSNQVSSSLPIHTHPSPSQAWSSSDSDTDSSSKLPVRMSSRKGSSSLLLTAALQGGNTSAPAAVVGAKAATKRISFQRTKTAMPFIMMTCRMCEDPQSSSLHKIRMYEPVTTTLLEHALSNAPDVSRVFVEVGAGTGYFSMLAASWGTDVVAFEPDAGQRVLLQHNAGMHRDGRLKVIPFALGSKTTLASIAGKQAGTSSGDTSAVNSTNATPEATTAGSSSSSDSAASDADSSSSSSSKMWGVDVLKLSDALSGDVEVTVLLVNAPSLDDVKVPGLPAAAEGMYDMLKRVQWVFLLGLPDYNKPELRNVLATMLARGNFSNLYSYGSPTQQQQQQQDDAEYESPQQQQQQQQQQDTVSYPADTHYVDVTEAIRSSGPDAQLQLGHTDFLFTREPLSTTLKINMPKKLIWDWQMGLAQQAQAQQAAAQNSGSIKVSGSGQGEPSAAAVTEAAAAPPSAPAPEAAAAEAAVAGAGEGSKGAEVQSAVTGVQEVTVQTPTGGEEKFVVIEETKNVQLKQQA